MPSVKDRKTRIPEPVKIHVGSRNSNPDEWFPFEFNHPIFGKQVAGEVILFRSSGSGDHLLMTGLWRSGPLSPGCDPKSGELKFPYTAPWGDENVHILEGSLTITNNETDEVHRFKAGDIFSISKGTDTYWEVDGPFCKRYVCITHSDPLD